MREDFNDFWKRMEKGEHGDIFRRASQLTEVVLSFVEKRRYMRLRKSDVYEITGVKESTIDKFENGDKMPRLNEVVKLLDCVGLRLNVVDDEPEDQKGRLGRFSVGDLAYVSEEGEYDGVFYVGDIGEVVDLREDPENPLYDLVLVYKKGVRGHMAPSFNWPDKCANGECYFFHARELRKIEGE